MILCTPCAISMIEHIRLPLKAKYTFCCAPINRKMPFVNTMFLKMARQYSKGDLISFDWLCTQVGWPFSPPETILDLIHLEAIHDVFDIYLWLSYRFPDMFPDVTIVREVQTELDNVIENGVLNIVELLKNRETEFSTRVTDHDEDDFEMKSRKKANFKNKWTHDDANMAGNKKTKSKKGKTQEDKQTDDYEQRNLSNSDSKFLFDNNDRLSNYVNLEGKRNMLKDSMAELNSKEKRKKPDLLSRLVNDGVITPKMAKKLKKEISDMNDD